jgi:stress response protein YsnF
MKTIIAAFCDNASAQQAIEYLRGRGVSNAQLLTHQPGDLRTQFSAFDVPGDRSELYAEVMRRGGLIVVAHTNDDARAIARDLDKMGSLDLDTSAKRWRDEGWNGYDMNELPYDAQACASERQALRSDSLLATEGRDLDVIEEQVAVGKREVDRGGVRIRTFISERPVEEQVQLREERIDVTREPVNEPISPEAVDRTLTEDEFVVTARGEEAVVGKEARVVERVHVGKNVDTRTETIKETERRRDVDVQPIEGDTSRRDTRAEDPKIRRR